MRKMIGVHFILLLILFSIFSFSLSAQEKQGGEEIYTIKRGDTLWDISAKFLKDPFLWPKLWQRNPYITNPHWIYPGRPIQLTLPEEVRKEEPPKVVKEPEVMKEPEVRKEPEVKKEPEVEKVEPSPVEKKPEVVAEVKLVEPVEKKPTVFTDIRSAGYVSDIDYRGIGIILDGKEDKNLFAEGDIVYLAFKTKEPVLIGNKYTVFRASENIRYPGTEKKIGKRYNILGNIKIIDQYGNFFTAKIIESFDAIEKGDLIQPYLKEKMEVEERKK
jgi:hypothetical protein